MVGVFLPSFPSGVGRLGAVVVPLAGVNGGGIGVAAGLLGVAAGLLGVGTDLLGVGTGLLGVGAGLLGVGAGLGVAGVLKTLESFDFFLLTTEGAGFSTAPSDSTCLCKY